jgi:hypothetical protein
MLTLTDRSSETPPAPLLEVISLQKTIPYCLLDTNIQIRNSFACRQCATRYLQQYKIINIIPVWGELSLNQQILRFPFQVLLLVLADMYVHARGLGKK